MSQDKWGVSTQARVMGDDLTTYARTRDPILRGELAVRHLPLVKFVARRLSAGLPDHVDLDDLVSWGSLGLLDALDKFEPARGHRFSTYAVTRIRGAILDGLQQMDWAPKQITSRVRAMRRVFELLSNELGTSPTDEQMAAAMDCSGAEIRSWRVDDYAVRLKTLDPSAGTERDPGEGAGGYRELSTHADQDVAGEIAEIRTRVALAIVGLTDRERAVCVLYYQECLTLREIAEHLGVSVSSATQTHTTLVEQVRGYLARFDGVLESA